MSEENVSTRLEGFGERFNFNEYEVQAYLAVLEHGTLTASRIADETDIPQPRVYDTVRSLGERGFVEIRDSRPIEVLAIDPEESFGAVQETFDDLVGTLEQWYQAPSRNAEAVSLVTSRQTILRYLEDVISSAEFELVLTLTTDLLARFEEELRGRREAGVTIELLLSPSADVPEPSEYDYTSVATVVRARRGLTAPIVAVADGTYTVYTTRTALRTDGDRYGVIFNRSELGFLVSGFLNTVVWPSAKTLVDSNSDRPFPRRYASIRRCVRDISESEGPFYATVRGRNVVTGEYRTVAGEIVHMAATSTRETAAITLDTGTEKIDVGGQAAALEDIEAYELAIGREAPPEL